MTAVYELPLSGVSNTVAALIVLVIAPTVACGIAVLLERCGR